MRSSTPNTEEDNTLGYVHFPLNTKSCLWIIINNGWFRINNIRFYMLFDIALLIHEDRGHKVRYFVNPLLRGS